jgi:hypothetical protein
MHARALKIGYSALQSGFTVLARQNIKPLLEMLRGDLRFSVISVITVVTHFSFLYKSLYYLDRYAFIYIQK